MRYRSTRQKEYYVTASQAILQGLSADGGLFVPERLPHLSQETLRELSTKSYLERANAVLSLFLDDFTPAEVAHCVKSAYASGRFDSDNIAELRRVGERRNV